MRHRTMLASLFTLVLLPATASAQDHSFLFTLTSPGVNQPASFIHYDAAYGRGTFEPFGADDIEQNLGLQTRLAESLTLVARMGLALENGSNRTSQHGELIAHLMRAENRIVDFSAGLGYRHEYGGTSVLLSRVVLGKRFESWQLFGNLLLEKAFSASRDEIDLITTVGCSRQLSDVFRLGFEVVGQDLEGFWDETEAEGGAVLFVGPSAGISFPGTAWDLTVGGGAIIRATQSAQSSKAFRDLPTGHGNGFVIRTVLSLGL